MTLMESANHETKTAKFEAFTKDGKTIEWRSHREWSSPTGNIADRDIDHTVNTQYLDGGFK